MKLQTKIKIQNTLAFVFLAFQCLIYLSNLSQPAESFHSSAYAAGHYTGLNLFLVISLILFLNVRSLKQKQQKAEQEKKIDSIGQTE